MDENLKFISTCAVGIEEFLIQELKEFNFKNIKKEPFNFRGRVLFEAENFEDVIRHIYRTRISNRIWYFLKIFKLTEISNWKDIIYEYIYSLDSDEFLDEYTSFAIRTKRRGKHPFYSYDVEKVAGQAVIDRFLNKKKKRPPVDLENPDLIIRVDVSTDNTVICGIDLVGYESLHKRGYRKYEHPAPIKGTIASAMLRLTEYEKEKHLLDPMAGGGTIPIEASMMAINMPSQFLKKQKLHILKIKKFEREKILEILDEEDKKIIDDTFFIYAGDKIDKHLEGAIENTKSLRVHNKIRFYVEDIKNLKYFFKNKKFDIIATNPPYGIKVAYPEEVKRVYRDFFKTLKEILKDKGRIALLTPRRDWVHEYAYGFGFEIKKEIKVYHGKLDTGIFFIEGKK